MISAVPEFAFGLEDSENSGPACPEPLLQLFTGEDLTSDCSDHHRSTKVSGGHPGDGEFSGSYFFDGIDDYLEVSDFDYGPSFTLTFWFLSTNNDGHLYQYMFSHGPVHARNSLSVYFTEKDHELDKGAIKTNLRDTDDPHNDRIFNTPVGLSDGRWHFYAATVQIDGTTVFLDGEPYLTHPQGGGAFDPDTDIIIGGRSDKMEERFYEGYLDDLRIYDGKLSAVEIKALFLADRK